jgi:hypothetical protein
MTKKVALKKDAKVEPKAKAIAKKTLWDRSKIKVGDWLSH